MQQKRFRRQGKGKKVPISII